MADIRDQKMPFMFEYWPDNATEPLKRFILPINPETYKITYPAKVGVIQTKGGVFVDNFGKGMPSITIQGTFGVKGSLPGGGGKHINGQQKDSWSLLKELEAEVFFEFYAQFGTTSKRTDKPASLRFFNFTDQHYYEVILNPFIVTRSIQRRFLYQYNMELKAVRDLAEPKKSIDPIASTLGDVQAPDATKFSTWKKILKGYTSVSTYVSDAINTMQSIEGTIETVSASVSGFRNGISDFIEAPFNLVETALKGIDSVVSSVVSLDEIPHEFKDHLRGMKLTFLKLKINQHLFKVTETTGTTANTTPSTLVEISTAPLPTGGTFPVTAAENHETTLFNPGIETAKDITTKAVTIKDSDTIESIAAKVLGDAGQWKRIAFLNQLESPFIAKEPEDAVSAATSKGTLVSVSGREVVLTNATATAGQILLLVDGNDWETAVIEGPGSVSGSFLLEEDLTIAFGSGATASIHDEKLNVLTPGDKINIPGDTGAANNIGAGGYQDYYDKILGADERTDVDGYKTASTAGTVDVVAGIANLEMQLQHRMRTKRGELAALGHPEYGSLLPTMIGKIDNPYWLERIRFEAKASILEDPRIVAVSNMNVIVDGTAVYIEADATITGEENSRRISVLV